jgi:hypothetical protein
MLAQQRFGRGEGGFFYGDFSLATGLDEAGKVPIKELGRAVMNAQAFEDGHAIAKPAVGERKSIAKLVLRAVPLPGFHFIKAIIGQQFIFAQATL